MENKLPKNWVVCTLNDLSQIQSGGTPSRSNKDYWNGDIPWIKISDIKDLYVEKATEFITEEGLKNSATRIFPKGTILFTIFATIGRIGILKIDATTNQAIAGITPSNLINHKYLTYSLIDLSNSISESGKGVAQKNINQAILKETLIPLPPLAEQNRIVAKLDALFAQHEAIKTSMEKVPELLKNFRQQVLTQAVTGKLTEEWRKGKELEEIVLKDENNKIELYDSILSDLIPDNWKVLKLETVSSKITDGEHQTPKRTEFGKMLLSAKNVRDGYVSYLDYDFISEIDFVKCLKRCKAEVGDILIVSVGATIGRTAIVKENIEFALVRSVALIKPSNQIESKYLMYVLQSKYLQNVIEKVSRGSAQSCLYINKIASLPFPFSTLKEQQEIVKRVESLFAKADAIEQQYKSLKAKIDTLPQAILHKAFKGELSEQLDTDGDARELLREIMILKEEQQGKVSKKKKVKV